MADLRGPVVPVLARYDQTVEIHWRMQSGQIVRVTLTSPEHLTKLLARKTTEALPTEAKP